MYRLARIQAQLKAPKNSNNEFGHYKYRSAEQILEAVKPLLDGAIITLSDEIVLIGDRYYVKATASFIDGDYTQSVVAYAREDENLKGMAQAQVTGACSSYARKYALGGLLAIDNNDDPDSMDNTQEGMITDEQIAKLQELGTDFNLMCKTLNLKSVKDLTMVKADAIITAKKAKQNA